MNEPHESAKHEPMLLPTPKLETPEAVSPSEPKPSTSPSTTPKRPRTFLEAVSEMNWGGGQQSSDKQRFLAALIPLKRPPEAKPASAPQEKD